MARFYPTNVAVDGDRYSIKCNKLHMNSIIRNIRHSLVHTDTHSDDGLT